MSTATTSLADTLPTTVPKLDSTGANWTVFLFRFQDAIDAKGFWGHFDGTEPIPGLSIPAEDHQLLARKQWEKDERSSKSLLNQKLPDSTMVLIHSKTTVKERWDEVVKEYTSKSEYAKTGLRAKFLGMKCGERGNVKEFLEGLRLKKEELCQAGVVIDETDYFSVIISSLPTALSNFASSQLAAARFSGSKSMSSNDLISMLIEEADRQKAQGAQRKGKGKEEESEALAAGETSRGKGKKKKNVECWNCGEKGHFKDKCPKPKKPSKEKPTGAANAAQPDEEEGAWAAVEEVEVDEADWFTEDDNVMIEGETSEVVVDFNNTSEVAFVVESFTKVDTVAELYDSGCTNHISPYRDLFEGFETIIPRKFRANGVGHFCKLRLLDVQYSPEISCTLVSIGQLDDAGFTMLFGDGKCVIRGPDGEKVGEIEKASRKVYKVEHEEGVVNAAEEILTLDKFHRYMGHISFETSGSKIFCESCVHAKATRKSVPKIREGERASEFGGEVHSDLWGKSPLLVEDERRNI